MFIYMLDNGLAKFRGRFKEPTSQTAK